MAPAPSGSKKTPAKPTGTIVVPRTGVTSTSSPSSKQGKVEKKREEASGSSASHAGESSKAKGKGKGKAAPPPKTPPPASEDSEMRDSLRASPAAGPSSAAGRVPKAPCPIPADTVPAERYLYTETPSPASLSLRQLLTTQTLVVTDASPRRNMSQYQIFAAINAAQRRLRDLDAQFEPMRDENWRPILLEYAEPPAHPGAPPSLDETGIPPSIEPLRDVTPPPLPPGHPEAAARLAERRAVKDAHFAHEERVIAREAERTAWRARATVDQEVAFFADYNERRDTFERDCAEIDRENERCRGARECVMHETMRARGQVDLWAQRQAAAAARDEDLRNIRWHQARLLDEFRHMDLERRALDDVEPLDDRAELVAEILHATDPPLGHSFLPFQRPAESREFMPVSDAAPAPRAPFVPPPATPPSPARAPSSIDISTPPPDEPLVTVSVPTLQQVEAKRKAEEDAGRGAPAKKQKRTGTTGAMSAVSYWWETRFDRAEYENYCCRQHCKFLDEVHPGEFLVLGPVSSLLSLSSAGARFNDASISPRDASSARSSGLPVSVAQWTPVSSSAAYSRGNESRNAVVTWGPTFPIRDFIGFYNSFVHLSGKSSIPSREGSAEGSAEGPSSPVASGSGVAVKAEDKRDSIPPVASLEEPPEPSNNYAAPSPPRTSAIKPPGISVAQTHHVNYYQNGLQKYATRPSRPPGGVAAPQRIIRTWRWRLCNFQQHALPRQKKDGHGARKSRQNGRATTAGAAGPPKKIPTAGDTPPPAGWLDPPHAPRRGGAPQKIPTEGDTPPPAGWLDPPRAPRHGVPPPSRGASGWGGRRRGAPRWAWASRGADDPGGWYVAIRGTDDPGG
ncbi:hypothetical protein DFH07DRAFT_968306 [Mycena maculata]|uniref:Uncharacterized protein n=1 Tax=Mycena maculata TaxID=230809 RepID=A0AAD7MUI9_9AGAR|nr:hypothetical protein DFH07DRAFT_968306 [Mycena maculata]